MADIRATVRTLLLADSALVALLPGGIFTAVELNENGLTSQNAPRTANGVTLAACAVLRWTGGRGGADMPYVAERRTLGVYIYEDRTQGYATIEAAENRIKALLQRRSIGVTDYSTGAYVLYTNSISEQYDESLLAHLGIVRFTVGLVRKV